MRLGRSRMSALSAAPATTARRWSPSRWGPTACSSRRRPRVGLLRGRTRFRPDGRRHRRDGLYSCRPRATPPGARAHARRAKRVAGATRPDQRHHPDHRPVAGRRHHPRGGRIGRLRAVGRGRPIRVGVGRRPRPGHRRGDPSRVGRRRERVSRRRLDHCRRVADWGLRRCRRLSALHRSCVTRWATRDASLAGRPETRHSSARGESL